MNVEYTGRQTTITKKLKTQTEAGLERIAKIIGDGASVHVILTTEKYRRAAELTVQSRNLKLVASCEATDMETALHDALAALEKQAIKQKKRKTTIKRNAKVGVREVAVAPTADGALVVDAELATIVARNGDARKVVPMLVHSFPSHSPLTEPHLVRSKDGVALRPMTLDEAVKEAAFRDREVFVFRDHGGQAMVLHRKRDGKMELIEVP
ncbi:MAG: ribosome-associated translation inhibitor RaiA [Edaphobacter sp.]|uniref:ribosome hibernation-promoting factor, HPF/YfiA family n=1 Tax=Edaphobacter sp. TaxID=1934404 RepID=UPI00238D0A02|nr:ribosome-associated translation inhibitor RaiA [Edaphobacter sp.]MDE1177595.1 ribosome-associated translation inhibitor RaiA [Edaphobacter sp.]